MRFKDLLTQFRLPFVAEPGRNVVFNLIGNHCEVDDQDNRYHDLIDQL